MHFSFLSLRMPVTPSVVVAWKAMILYCSLLGSGSGGPMLCNGNLMNVLSCIVCAIPGDTCRLGSKCAAVKTLCSMCTCSVLGWHRSPLRSHVVRSSKSIVKGVTAGAGPASTVVLIGSVVATGTFSELSDCHLFIIDELCPRFPVLKISFFAGVR